MQHPPVSVIIPTHNREHYVMEAVNSVLQQTVPAFELIVVDDGSTDGSARLLESLGSKLRYVYQPNRGIGAARNAGVACATGEFIAFLDDDDVWLPDKLQRQLAAFDKEPALEAVYGHGEQFVGPDADAHTRKRFERHDGRIVPASLASTLLIRCAAFNRVGGFDESLRIGIEMEWYSRLCESGIVTRMLDAVVYRRRLHASNLNVTYAHDQSERLHVLKQALDRRRRAKPST